MNVNGGAHAGYSLDIQEFMIVPVGAPSFAEAVHFASGTFHSLRTLLKRRRLSVSVGDEGGFAPRLSGNDQACELVVEAIEAAGHRPREDMALDPPANARKATNTALLKLNQIGTLTGTMAAIDLCRSASWAYVLSHRSGETADFFIADFAVTKGGGHIKAGAPSRGERAAKYNRLLAIERALGKAALFFHPFFARA